MLRSGGGRGRGAKWSGQTWAMGSAATCFEPPGRSFLFDLDGPAEMLARIDELGVRGGQS